MVALILTTVVTVYAVWGVFISRCAVLLAAGTYAYDGIVYAAFNTRIFELTGKDASGHVKGVRNKIRNTFNEARDRESVFRELRPLVGLSQTATRTSVLMFYRDVSYKLDRVFSETERKHWYRLLPFCGESSKTETAAMIAEAGERGRLAERRGAFAAAEIVDEIRKASSLVALHHVYGVQRRRRMHMRFRAQLDIRRLFKGRGSLHVVYWKRVVSYSGKGGGVGAIVSYAMYNAPVLTHMALSPTVIGGTLGLLAFCVKTSSIITAQGIPAPLNNRAMRFLKRHTLIAVVLAGVLAAIFASAYKVFALLYGG
ncbi:hypothetical protein [Mycobacteroides abscessus]|uniref:hypothetical protein n=1 Tax=Mycobacteroides abscessus TaxID=36809 RepID=UPI000E69F5D6|nr:hypothetical protein [Mycobacteroides abscessus]RIS81270.1 hypothetical protein D2E44_14515 [Mycobacteroides abscessus]